MDDDDILDSLDADGELGELVKARKWALVSSICEKRIKRGDSQDAFKVKITLIFQNSCCVSPSKRECVI